MILLLPTLALADIVLRLPTPTWDDRECVPVRCGDRASRVCESGDACATDPGWERVCASSLQKELWCGPWASQPAAAREPNHEERRALELGEGERLMWQGHPVLLVADSEPARVAVDHRGLRLLTEVPRAALEPVPELGLMGSGGGSGGGSAPLAQVHAGRWLYDRPGGEVIGRSLHDTRAPRGGVDAGWWAVDVDTPWAGPLKLWTPWSPSDAPAALPAPPPTRACGCDAPATASGLGAALLALLLVVRKRSRP